MCELTEVDYLDGEIVWVKLGPCWWPGEVWGEERLPEDVLQGLKKMPIAVVKFFQEESFEYVKNVSNIYKYNCSKKEEFIKKGLDKYRAKNTYMEKFPADIRKAEELTKGDPDIISDPKYALSPKSNYNDTYGTPVEKKMTSMKGINSTPSTSKIKSSPIRKAKTSIMSPRSPMQTPRSYVSGGSSQYNTPDGSDSPAKFNCYLCGYRSNRVNVIVLHLKQHSAGLITSPLSISNRSSLNSSFRQSPARASGSRNTNSVKNDLRPIRKTELSATKEMDKSIKGKMSPGVTPKGRKRGRPPKKAETETTKKLKPDHEIKSKLLADWSDDQDSDADVNATLEEDVDKAESSSDKDSAEQVQNTKSLNVSESRTSSIDKSEDEMKSKSCFDFEEDDVIDVPKSPGRKIPRLITKKTKKEFEYTPEPADAKSEESPQSEESVKSPVANSSEPEIVAETSNVDDSKNFEIDFDDLLSVTKPPELPEIPKDKFETEVESTNKPLREIMSPKERGKRIFKSKQIFKTRMQEKYGSDLKFTDMNDEILDNDESVKADLIAIVEKSASQPGASDDKDNDKEISQTVEVLQIIAESDAAENTESSNHDVKLKTSDNSFEINKKQPEQDLSLQNVTDEPLKSNKNKQNDDIFATQNSPCKRRKSNNSISESKAVLSPAKSIPDVVSDKTELISEKTEVLDKTEAEVLTSDITLPDVPPQDRSAPDMTAPDTPIPNIPVPEILSPDKPAPDKSLLHTPEGDLDLASGTLDTTEIDSLSQDNLVQDTAEVPPADIDVSHLDQDEHQLISQSLDKREMETSVGTKSSVSTKSTSPEKSKVKSISTHSPKRKNRNSNLNDAECLMNFSESLFTEKEKEKPVTPTRNKRSPRRSVDFSLETPGEKVPINFGLGSLDNTVPLDPGVAIEPLKSKIANNASTDPEKPVAKVIKQRKSIPRQDVEVKKNINQELDVPDIQSYITGKSQPEREIKMLSSSRLHNILTETAPIIKTDNKKIPPTSNRTSVEAKDNDLNLKPKQKFVIKLKNDKKEQFNKDIIKSAIDQIEDIETFVIEKPKHVQNQEVPAQQPKPGKTEIKIVKKTASRKPAINTTPKQTVIMPKAKVPAQEDSIFDINSMPIVLSDELITAENIDQMSMALSKSDTNIILDNNVVFMDKKPEIHGNKLSGTKSMPKMQILKKVDKTNTVKLQLQKATTTSTNTQLTKNQRLYQSPTKTKILKNSPTVMTQPGNPGKFIVMTSSAPPTGSKYTVGKRLQQKSVSTKIASNNANETNSQLKIGNKTSPASKPIVQKVVHQKVNIDSSGNTVLFITNSNGEQSKVVLTPDQKIKSSLTPQTIVTSKGAIINPRQSNPIVTTSKPSQLILTSKGQLISRSSLQTTPKLSPVTIKQKSSQIGQTLLTPKGSLINSGPFLTSTGQLVPSNQQLAMSKGNVLTPLTANQMKKIRSQNANQKIIINKKPNIVMQQTGIIKEKSITNKIVQNAIEKPKAPAQKKGFVKLSAQQLAEMEKMGYVEETEHGKIITQEGIKYMQTMSKEKGIKIQTVPHRKVKPNTTLKKVTTVPGSIDHVTTTQKRSMVLKKQPALPPLTPIGDSPKKSNQQESIYQKVPDIQAQSITTESESAGREPIQNEQVINQVLPNSKDETVPPTADIAPNELGAQVSTEPTLSAISDAQLLAVPGETFGGPIGTFILCSVEDNGNLTPIDNQPLYLDANNQLVPVAGVQDATLSGTSEEAATSGQMNVTVPEVPEQVIAPTQFDLLTDNSENQQIIINADGQQFVLDQQSFLALSEQQILTMDGQQLIIQGNAQEILAALAANQEVNMLDENSLTAAGNATYQHEFGNKDILATALANTNVFQNEGANSDLEIYQNLQTDYKHSSVSETSTALSQPIMSPLELPSKKPDENDKIEGMSFNQNIDDSLAVIGVNSTNVPTSLDLPITITNPKIAPKSTNPLNMACEMIYQSSSYSPVTSKELATGDIFQPQDVSMNDQTILHSSDVATTLSMPDISGMDSEMALNKIESSETNFSSESMPLLNDEPDTPSKTVSSMDISISEQNQNIHIDYSENLPAEIVASPSTVSDDKELNKAAKSDELDMQQKDETLSSELLEKDETNVNNENFQSEEVGTVEKEEYSLSMDNAELKSDSSTDKKIVPTTCIEKSMLCESVNNTDIAISKTNGGESSHIEISEAISSQVSENDILIKNTIDVTPICEVSTPIKNGENENGIASEAKRSDNVISAEEPRQEVTTPITSEINIITENLNFGSETSDLLTPDTIPETIISPRSPAGDVPQDFCESSNSVEIPIQPNLVFDKNESILNNKSESDQQTMENVKENDSENITTNDIDPPSLFDFDTR